jgi:polysaccharide export outer membrane protein
MFRTLHRLLASPFSRIAAGAVLLASALTLPAAAQDGYHLQPGDVVQVEVLEDPSLNRSLLVLPDGSINFPQVGTVRAGGRTVDQLRGALTSGLAPNFAEPPNIYVTVGSVAPPAAAAPGAVAGIPANAMPVYVMGEVGAPGRRDIEPGTNLLQFLAQAGTLTRFAARNRIELHRIDSRSKTANVYLFDLDRVGGGEGRISGMTTLGEGDVVIVPQRRLFE